MNSQVISQARFDELTAQSEATFSAKILADSIHPHGIRLTTMELTYPRCIHAEFMTHRQFSRNSASSRAIPLPKMRERIVKNPFFPLHWGKAQKGMQAEEELSPYQKLRAATEWMIARDSAVQTLDALEEIGIHKQIGNRVTEPWMWITVIATATNWENLFSLRCHPMAEPHFQKLAYLARGAYDASQPDPLAWGEWHLPLIRQDDDGIAEEDLPKISAGRCARVSYLTHEGIRDPQEDIKLYERLAHNKPMHASPLEHQAKATVNAASASAFGNFDFGWHQFRKMHTGECATTRG